MKNKILLLFLFCTVMFSCTEEENNVIQEEPLPKVKEMVGIAKSFLDMTKCLSLLDLSKNRAAPEIKSQSSSRYRPLDVIPVWDEAQCFLENGNGNEKYILLVPLNTPDAVSVMRRMQCNNEVVFEQSNVFSKLLITKDINSNMGGAFVISYIPDRKYLKEKDHNINKLGYNLLGTNFSGIYIVSSLDGALIHGCMVDSGKLVYRIYPGCYKKESDCMRSNSNLKQSHPLDLEYKLQMIFFTQTRTRMSYQDLWEDDKECKCSTCWATCDDCNCLTIYPDHGENGYKCPVCGSVPCACSQRCLYCGSNPCRCSSGCGDEGGYDPYPGGGGGGGSGGIVPPPPPIVTNQKTRKEISDAVADAVKKVLSDHNNDKSSPYCSEGVRNAFNKLFSSKELNNMNANAMTQHWKSSSNWSKINMSDAQRLANEGYFVVAGWINPSSEKSGHVVVIVPGTEQPGWGKMVPNSMDTGRDMKTTSQRLSLSFSKPKSSKIEFFKYN